MAPFNFRFQNRSVNCRARSKIYIALERQHSALIKHVVLQGRKRRERDPSTSRPARLTSTQKGVLQEKRITKPQISRGGKEEFNMQD